MEKRFSRHNLPFALLAIVFGALLPLLTSCDGGGGAVFLINAQVRAADGGTFKDREVQPTLIIIIPPSSLSSDATLTVSEVGDPPPAGESQTAASRAFSVSLGGAAGSVSLREPMTIEMAVDPLPVHPQVGEIARLNGSRWERLQANFFRKSQGTVTALTTLTNGTFRAVHRSLQRTGGEAAAAGQKVFMDETFGNEFFFGDVIGLHTVLNGVSPSAAVSLGVQVDLSKVPVEIAAVLTGGDLAAKDAALQDPSVTRALIKAGAVIGVKGVFASTDPSDTTLVRVGITCSLCHVTVKPTTFQLTAGPTALPIGVPNFDGVPNSAMNAGAILALTPFVQAAGQATINELNSWGPGLFDIRALPDNPLDDGVSNATAFPPLWNFVDLEAQGYLFGWDGLFKNDGINNTALASQAEAVYDLVMHANGAFGTATATLPPELSAAPPQELLDALAQAEASQPGNVVERQKLLDLQTWMRSIVSPEPGGFDETLALQGFALFFGKANCAACHSSSEFTGPGTFTDITATPPSGALAGGIKIPGLRGVRHTAPYFHDGSASSLEAVVARFVARGNQVPLLNAEEQRALVEYLKSL